MEKLKNFSLWLLALILTVGISYYQKTTGPTWPKKMKFSCGDIEYNSKLLRSHYSDSPLPVKIFIGKTDVKGQVKHKRFGVQEEYDLISMVKNEGYLIASIPPQPPAGKIQYFVELFDLEGNKIDSNIEAPVVARFKGHVSGTILILHIFFMFFGVFLAIKTLINCFIPGKKYILLLHLTAISTFVGGIILGPLVQKSAFGDYWTGFPFGTDLTDNKILISMTIWIFAIVFKRRRSVVIASALFMLLVYLIPHSTLGSELDYKTGKMKNKFSRQIQKGFTDSSDLYFTFK